jgi:glycerophosphoryl diester phosphodiesterase
MSPRIIAHCGDARHAPESTMPAFEHAIINGAAGLEFDVHLTADDKLVVHHDYNLGRVFAGWGPISALCLSEVRHLGLSDEARKRHGVRYCDVEVPTLAEVLDLGRGKVRFELDLRTPDMRLLHGVIDEIRRSGVREDAELTSGHVPLVCRVGEINPALRTGIFFGPLPAYLTSAQGLDHVVGWLRLARARVAHLPISRIDETLVGRLHELGFLVHGANLNSEEAIQAGIDLEIDQFTTDELELALSLTQSAEA